MGGIQPGSAALDIDEGLVGDDTADAAGYRGKPVTLGGARKCDQARRCSLYIKSCDVGLDTEDSPARLEIVSDLSAAKKAAPAVLGEGKTNRG